MKPGSRLDRAALLLLSAGRQAPCGKGACSTRAGWPNRVACAWRMRRRVGHFLVDVLPWEQQVWIVPPEQLSLSQYVRYRWWKARTFRSSLKLSRPQWYGFLSHEGRWVSMLEIVHRPAKVGVEDVRLGLVGAVTTLPQARGKGYASVLLRESIGFISDRLKCDFAWLMCAEDLVPFYERLGLQRVQGPFYFQQPGGRVQGELAAMAFACQGRSWPEGELDLCGLPL